MTFPFAPLEAAVARFLGDTYAARALRLSADTVARYRRNGLTTFQADRLAVRIGLHPASIWPNWFEGAAELEEAAV